MATFEIILVLILTVINGLLAMAEMSVASSRLPKLKAMAEQGVTGARRAIALAENPGRFLSTVQIGITLIGVLTGAVSGAALGEDMSAWLQGLGLSEDVAEPLGFGGVIVVITYLSLIIGELVPKQVALSNPERLACLVAPAMTLLAKVAAPIVWLLDRSGRLVLKLIGQGGKREQTVTDAEIHSMITEAESAGVLEPEERDMIAGVMRLGDRKARSVMVPRVDVEMIDVDATLQDVSRRISAKGHSRFVVYKDSPDNVIGVLQAKDIAVAALRKRPVPLKTLVKQAPAIPETLDALDIVARLKESETHIGLVVDEYGHFEGIVTNADILEAIVGAFEEEKRDVEPAFLERADGSVLVAGWMPVDELAARFSLPLPEKRSYSTAAGYVLDQLGRMPKLADQFESRGYRFEVVDLDGRRIDKILVSKAGVRTHRLV